MWAWNLGVRQLASFIHPHFRTALFPLYRLTWPAHFRQVSCWKSLPVWAGSPRPCLSLLLKLRMVVVSALRLLHQMRPFAILGLNRLIQFLETSFFGRPRLHFPAVSFELLLFFLPICEFRHRRGTNSRNFLEKEECFSLTKSFYSSFVLSLIFVLIGLIVANEWSFFLIVWIHPNQVTYIIRMHEA